MGRHIALCRVHTRHQVTRSADMADFMSCILCATLLYELSRAYPVLSCRVHIITQPHSRNMKLRLFTPVIMLLPNHFAIRTSSAALLDMAVVLPLACAILIQLCQVALRQVSRVSSTAVMQAASHQQAEHHSPMTLVTASHFNSIYTSADSDFVPSVHFWDREMRDRLPWWSDDSVSWWLWAG